MERRGCRTSWSRHEFDEVCLRMTCMWTCELFLSSWDMQSCLVVQSQMVLCTTASTQILWQLIFIHTLMSTCMQEENELLLAASKRIIRQIFHGLWRGKCVILTLFSHPCCSNGRCQRMERNRAQTELLFSFSFIQCCGKCHHQLV